MRAPVNRDRIERLLLALGRSLHGSLRFYLVGGSTLVDLGLREATLDVDYVALADDQSALSDLERRLPHLKDELDINVEPASPSDFMPVSTGAITGSHYIRSYGPLAMYHYHYPSQILAKVARGAERDLADVELLLRAEVVTWDAVEAAWAEVRARDTGWLRHTPRNVERRVDLARRRLRDVGLLSEA